MRPSTEDIRDVSHRYCLARNARGELSAETTKFRTVARAASVLLAIAAMGMGCSGKHAKFAPPADAPEPPDGNGWFCFHATSPHAISSCKRDLQKCNKMRNAYVAEKTEALEQMPEKPRTETVPRGVRDFMAAPGEEDSVDGNDQPSQPESGGVLEGICVIDPSACAGPVYEASRQSIPTYSACIPKEQAYCSAYYHEFNYWRPYEENHWRFFCAESAKSCEVWRDLMHLHLAKRPCTPVL